MKPKKSIVFFSFLLSLTVNAQVTLPNIFGNGMVLQQESQVNIWGKSTSKNEILVSTSWNNKMYTAQPKKDGEWLVTVSTPNAGGPYEITIDNGKKLKLTDVLIGEVWICSGQSNMYMKMTGFRNQPVKGAQEDIVLSTNNKIRLFTVERALNDSPLDDFNGNWQKSEPQTVSNFSATAYYFGKMISDVKNVPVGLISSSWGGTRIEPWMSEEAIEECDFIGDGQKNNKQVHQRPSNLFNAMINPMTKLKVRGAIWYQGEANRKSPENYKELLLGLIKDWRLQWNDDGFAFYYAQIAPYDYGDKFNSAFIRQSMLDVSLLDVPNTGMACLMDVGEKDNIHPANKKVVGNRLAYLALNKTYAMKGIEFSGPVLKEVKTEGKFLNLYFNHAENGLTTYGKPLENFEIAGPGGRFFRAKGFLTKEGVTLYSNRVENPIAVRYAFKDWVVGELFNNEGLPASSFVYNKK